MCLCCTFGFALVEEQTKYEKKEHFLYLMRTRVDQAKLKFDIQINTINQKQKFRNEYKSRCLILVVMCVFVIISSSASPPFPTSWPVG
jgi:hypothetical protein